MTWKCKHIFNNRNVTGLSIVNGAPSVENVDPEILKLCDIFCINETEVCE